MTEKRVERRLAAILAADVVGYSRLTGADEEGTVSRLRALRQELIDPVIAAHGGRTVKLMGDGRLVEFASVVDAVRSAIGVQRGMTARNANVAPDKRIEFRVGIHLGDVMVESDGDLMGDGVNIAARLEGIAEPGGICLSNAAYEQVRDKVNEQFTDLGDKELKNIARPVRVYRIEPKAPSVATAQETAKAPLALPNKPSIAVLPFQNMSDDPGQEYFADGMVEEIITGLSRIRWLFVIARNSTFAYKGKSPDIRQVGRELGVRYVLEGSVRKAAGRVRITGQLIDTTVGAHIWADRFEGGLDDIFDLQDRVTASVVGAIEPALRGAEIQRAQTKPTSSLDAYDYFLRAQREVHLLTRAGMAEALAFCEQAIAIDRRYASAYGLAAWCCTWRIVQGWSEHPDEERTQGIDHARTAMSLGANDPEALWMAGHVLSLLGRELDLGADVIDRSLSINPNCAEAWNISGYVRWYRGEGDKAIDHFQRAMRLSPLDPYLYAMKTGMAFAHFVEGRYEEAVNWADAALHEQPKFMTALRVKLAACGMLGRSEAAAEALRMALLVDPVATVRKQLMLLPAKRPDIRSAYAEGLRKAGLPQ